MRVVFSQLDSSMVQPPLLLSLMVLTIALTQLYSPNHNLHNIQSHIPFIPTITPNSQQINHHHRLHKHPSSLLSLTHQTHHPSTVHHFKSQLNYFTDGVDSKVVYALGQTESLLYGLLNKTIHSCTTIGSVMATKQSKNRPPDAAEEEITARVPRPCADTLHKFVLQLIVFMAESPTATLQTSLSVFQYKETNLPPLCKDENQSIAQVINLTEIFSSNTAPSTASSPTLKARHRHRYPSEMEVGLSLVKHVQQGVDKYGVTDNVNRRIRVAQPTPLSTAEVSVGGMKSRRMVIPLFPFGLVNNSKDISEGDYVFKPKNLTKAHSETIYFYLIALC